MASTEQETKGSVTLKGSSDLVKEYLDYGINSILYQRGIYPAETFVPAEHFGITMYMSTDEKIKSFLKSVLEQIRDWLCQKKMQKVSLIISNSATKEVLERWDFKVQYEGDGNATESGKTVGNKDFTLIQKEIRSVLRQISGTVSFLPLLDCLCHVTVGSGSALPWRHRMWRGGYQDAGARLSSAPLVTSPRGDDSPITRALLYRYVPLGRHI